MPSLLLGYSVCRADGQNESGRRLGAALVYPVCAKYLASFYGSLSASSAMATRHANIAC